MEWGDPGTIIPGRTLVLRGHPTGGCNWRQRRHDVRAVGPIRKGEDDRLFARSAPRSCAVISCADVLCCRAAAGFFATARRPRGAGHRVRERARRPPAHPMCSTCRPSTARGSSHVAPAWTSSPPGRPTAPRLAISHFRPERSGLRHRCGRRREPDWFARGSRAARPGTRSRPGRLMENGSPSGATATATSTSTSCIPTARVSAS